MGTDRTKKEWLVDEHPSTMTQRKLDQLRERHDIPSSVRLRAPTGNEKLSTPPFGWEWMAQLEVAPHHMNLNVYRTMRSPYHVGFCYLQSAVGKMIESNPSSQKTWKPHWLYVSGAWEFLEGAEPRRPKI
ncbi:unnamed protein product [Prunus armeniaca]